MNEQDEWASLQDAWGASRPASVVPDVGLMIARARRERRMTVLVLVGEWAMMIVGAAVLAAHWQRVATNGYETLWLGFQTLLMGVIMVVYTWTRLAALHEPVGTSLRDWLALEWLDEPPGPSGQTSRA